MTASTDAYFAQLDEFLAAFGEADRPRGRKLVADLAEMATRQPRLAERCYAYQARLYTLLEEYEQAQIAVEKALLLMPFDDGLQILRGDILRESDEYSHALYQYSRIIDQNPESVTARMRRAEMHQAHGDLPAALADLNAALKHEPRSLRLLYRRGLLLSQMGRVAEAAADFEKVVHQSPEAELRQKARERLRELGENW